MMRTSIALLVVAGLWACGQTVGAHVSAPEERTVGAHFSAPDKQLGQIGKGISIAKKANEVRDLQMTDEEEQQLGLAVSERIRTRYGVAQDAAVHR